MSGMMMLARFVGVMALHPLMSCPHRGESSLRRCPLAENGGQDREH